MRLKEQKFSGVSVSSYPWIHIDHHVTQCVATYAVYKTGTGDVTYKVQATLENPGVETSCKAFDLVSGKSTDFQGSISTVYGGLRLVTTAVSGTSSLVFQVLQTGN